MNSAAHFLGLMAWLSILSLTFILAFGAIVLDNIRLAARVRRLAARVRRLEAARARLRP